MWTIYTAVQLYKCYRERAFRDEYVVSAARAAPYLGECRAVTYMRFLSELHCTYFYKERTHGCVDNGSGAHGFVGRTEHLARTAVWLCMHHALRGREHERPPRAPTAETTRASSTS